MVHEAAASPAHFPCCQPAEALFPSPRDKHGCKGQDLETRERVKTHLAAGPAAFPPLTFMALPPLPFLSSASPFFPFWYSVLFIHYSSSNFYIFHSIQLFVCWLNPRCVSLLICSLVANVGAFCGVLLRQGFAV